MKRLTVISLLSLFLSLAIICNSASAQRSQSAINNLQSAMNKTEELIKNIKALQDKAKDEVAQAQEDCKQADEHLKNLKYKKAIKDYTKVIKNYGINNSASTYAFYRRGNAYLLNGNYHLAINDLERVLKDTNAPELWLDNSRSMLADAKRHEAGDRNWREQHRKQRDSSNDDQFAVAIAQSFLMLGNTIVNGGSASTTNYGVYNQSAGQGSSSSSAGTTNNSLSSKKDCPSLKASNGKYYCANTGKCAMCGGDGMMSGSFGQGANAHKCTLCNGTGKCKWCN